MAYELWNRESANIVGAWDDEGAALMFVREMVDEHGPDVVLAWALAFEDENEETHLIAVGEDLLHRARTRVPA